MNDKLVSSLRRGDLLFADDFRQAELFEDSWLAKRLRLGGKCVIEELAAHPDLETVEYNQHGQPRICALAQIVDYVAMLTTMRLGSLSISTTMLIISPVASTRVNR